MWTLTLRPGVKFSDGTPYDAAAVEFNWARDKASTSALAGAAGLIKSMKVVSPTTLQVTLVAPDSSFNRTVAQQLLFIASPAAIKKEGASFGTHPVGAGPFILNSWVRNSQKSFARQPGLLPARAAVPEQAGHRHHPRLQPGDHRAEDRPGQLHVHPGHRVSSAS